MKQSRRTKAGRLSCFGICICRFIADVEAVFIRRTCSGNHRATELGMPDHRDIKAAVAGKNTGLLNHRVVVAVHCGDPVC
ncbi:hypothetical protein [Rahnella aceris]|uniref:hypothetical protein n=1 Tax=Rahnella sp. (strain Y9602) TaxID=2703885 RepID=UPI001C27E5E3|nr:hypothetical protein [Rahnella aceris]MBU9851826.1 hypothetical protein [Rahnella aceris]